MSYPSIGMAYKYLAHVTYEVCERVATPENLHAFAEATGKAALVPARFWLGSTRPGESEIETNKALLGISDTTLCRKVGYSVFASAGVALSFGPTTLLTIATNY